MKFESVKINEFLRDTDHYLIPDLQRGYVWKKEKVTKLFDSLLFKLPIASLLLWKYETAEDLFAFYKIKSSKDAELESETAIQNRSIIVLDGQQRLTSLNILFNEGIWEKGHAFYINLLDDNLTSMKLEITDREEVSYLKLSKKQLPLSPTECWVKTKTIWKLAEVEADFFKLKEELEKLAQPYQYESEVEKIISKNYDRVKKIFDLEIPTICLKEQNPENLLEAFTRLNNQGQSLSKADLIFSAAKCKNADAHSFLKELSANYKEESSFLSNRDAVIRLMFAKEIKNSQVDLKGLEKVLEAVVNHKKFWEDNLESFNDFLEKQFTEKFNVKEPAHAACIIAFLYLSKFEFCETSQDKISEFLVRALLFAVWTASIDSVIGSIAQEIEKSTDTEEALLQKIYQVLKSNNKNLDLDEKVLGKEKTKDQKVFYHILALQGHNQNQWFETKFEKDLDHIFPKKLLKENGIEKEHIEDYRNKAFLPSRKNKAKSAKHPTRWFEELNEQDKQDCKKYGNIQALDWVYISQLDKEADIPKVYEAFLEHREDLIRKSLKLEIKEVINV